VAPNLLHVATRRHRSAPVIGCQVELLVFLLAVPPMPAELLELEEKAGLARCVCTKQAESVVFPEHRVQDGGVRPPGREGEGRWSVGPVKPQRALCGGGASFGTIPEHNAGLCF